MDFLNGRYFGKLVSDLAASRASSATDLIYTDASGAAYSTYGNNVPVLSSGKGLLSFEARTNVLLNSLTPATQTTGSLGTGTYTFWVNGSGSAAVSAGTATITGAGTATNGTPVTFTVTAAGTVTVTVTGSLNAFQLENGASATSLIITTGATASRAADVITTQYLSGIVSIFGQGRPLCPASYANSQTLVSVDDNSLANRIQADRVTATALGRGVYTAASTTGTFSTANAWTQAASMKLICVAQASDQAVDLNGGSVVTASQVGTPTLNTIHLGCRGDGAFQFNGVIERIAAFIARPSNSQLPTITT
jgi:hypothetical protein